MIGGKSVTAPAVHYPHRLAKLLVDGFEKQFDIEYNKVSKPKDVAKSTEVLAVEEYELATDDEESLNLGQPAGEDDSASSEEEEKPNMKIFAGLKAAIKRLHDSTRHHSNVRLARALAISGAPAEAIYAAKHHKCDICQEKRRPKTRRPAFLPAPKDAGDQASSDLIDGYDSSGNKFTAVRVIDYATRFQLAELLPRKTAANAISFLKKRWLPVFGCPRTLVADQRREYISHELAFSALVTAFSYGTAALEHNGKMEFVKELEAHFVSFWHQWSMRARCKVSMSLKKPLEKLLELPAPISMSLE